MFKLPEEIKYVMNRIKVHGFNGYLVGGCVRDAIMGLKISDFDITTDALPTDIVNIFYKDKVKLNGFKHGTVTVIVGKFPVEVTTHRVEGSYSDKRHPDSVEFSNNLKDDLSRRDFTINALAYNQKDGLIDYFGGLQDIRNKIIRCVGIADHRFEEDALRILRALRFSSTLGFTIDDDSARSIHNKKHNLRDISVERITSELSKMLCGSRLDLVLREFYDVLVSVIPELVVYSDDPEMKLELLLNVPPVLHLRLSALFLDIQDSPYEDRGYLASSIMRKMKFEGKVVQRVGSIVSNFDIKLSEDEKYVKYLMNEISPEILMDILEIKGAYYQIQSNKAHERKAIQMLGVIDSIIEKGECYSLEDLAIDGNYILELGVKQGKIVGEVLEYALEQVINGQVNNDEEELIKLAKDFIENKLALKNFYMPSEWETHERTFIAWPVRDSLIWNDNYEEVCKGYAQVANSVSEFETVTVILNSGDEIHAKNMINHKVNTIQIAHNDGWIRDSGPTFLISKDEDVTIGVNWRFNAWGEKYQPYDLDDKVASKIVKHYGLDVVDVPIVLEGGSIHVDGEGTLLTTEQCLLNPNRNPYLSRNQIEGTLKRTLNVSKIIWLNKGIYGDETDGHVDNVVRFLRPGTILIQTCSDKSDPDYEISKENLDILKSSVDAKGRKFRVIEIEKPPLRRYNGQILVLSYINFYFVNGGIVMPVFGGSASKTDVEAEKVLRREFPNRSIVKVDGINLAKEGGNVHCITQQMPMVRGKKSEEDCL